MEFKKISNEKIKIILNISDLQNENIDFQSFMSNPLSSQDFFLKLMTNAEKSTGFNTKINNLKIEIISLGNIDFIITISKINDSNLENLKNQYNIAKIKKLNNSIDIFNNNILNNSNTLRKSFNTELIENDDISKSQNTISIYCFEDFFDYYDFKTLISKTDFYNQTINKITLYEYNKNFFLIINKLYFNNIINHKIDCLISEFSTCVDNYFILIYKLSEYGKIILNT